MYIQPSSTIAILRNIPLDITYKNSIYFTSSSAQETYFLSKAKPGMTFTSQSYQRHNRYTLRIQTCADLLYDCNYLMFKNENFGNNRWFYAFITAVKYINNNVAEVQYAIDVLQTWMFDYTLNQCYIERQHASSDSRTKNIIPEGMSVGELKVNSENGILNSTSFDYYVGTSQSADSAGNTYALPARVINGIPIGTGVIECENIEAFENIIEWIVSAGKEDAIANVWCVPDDIDSGLDQTSATTKTYSYELPTSLDGYTPRNKKLLQYPYCQVEVLNGSGGTMTLAPERFSSSASFKTFSVALDSGSITIIPTNYNGSANNNEFSLSSIGFPSGATPTNPYASWLNANSNSIQAQKANANASMTSSAFSSFVGAGIGIAGLIAAPATGGASIPVSAAAGLAAANATKSLIGSGTTNQNTLRSIQAQEDDMKMLPSTASGTATGSALFMGGFTGFKVRMKTLRAEQAKSFDEFFDMFGYKVNRRAVPNRSVRSHWTFVKTAGCTIKGSIPSDDEDTICAIYDSGITWWNNGDEVGDYSLDNTL